MRGSIIKREGKRGTYYDVVFDLEPDPVTGRRRQKWIRGFRNKKEAEAVLAQGIAEMERGTYLEPTKLTVREYLKEWFAIHASKLSPTTRRRYEDIIRNQLQPNLGSIPLQKLTPLHVETFLRYLEKEGRRDNKKTAPLGLAPSTVGLRLPRPAPGARTGR